MLVDLVNIFETFLPQLLRYPNPSDPLNGDAANLLLRDPAAYNKKVEEYVQRYACGTSRPPLPAAVSGKRPFDDMKDPDLGVRKDSAATATTAESACSTHADEAAAIEEDDRMSDASELSDL